MNERGSEHNTQPKLSVYEKTRKIARGVLGLRDITPSVGLKDGANYTRSEKRVLVNEYGTSVVILAEAILNQTGLKFTPEIEDEH